ncbi:DNA (cytosine-5-)-methyltransferase., Type II site-specific deoxyribonuclease [Sulfurimonas denitrificans DSM 1251]|uniref:Cytosine-specific methyltransferase n=1 Tax=Sulfurimonas denitrificans (strain ATCC 33889 / DSM 1251) TaxID=326298 RepID=Q30PG8_SULDN|nr:HpaII family restriction endonuclease [Sulfurimonas denitrificans]ABB45113.1 DNA (cytosine-5-)-methyltransferase., Type II site-specific deoxyribonuclease [Sulfurimonas denitrificans DSM 1251]MDD3646865.1 HpaII family restriction endonuclease [Candidatus Gracilibacteria bacterium]
MNNKKFTFIDLFAGIGGFHQAMHELGGECVFASEIDIYARKTYKYNFKKYSPELFENGLFNEDIKTIMPEEIPDFDLLCAGFPCQPFSQAGKKYGFDDNHKSERGNLFFDIAEIIKVKRPKAFFLENVRGLVNHDNGNTFKTIQHILTEELGYSFYHQIIKASDYGLPQLRPRTFMIGFRDEDILKGFNFPPKIPLKFNMSDVWGGECSREIGFTVRVGGRGSNIDDRRNWDAYLVNGEVKRLSFKEAQKIQGFPDDFHFPVSPTHSMKQLGNSVAIDAVKAVGSKVIEYMNNLNKRGKPMNKTNNKGEWSELFAFIKILLEQKLLLSDKELNPTGDFFKINKITTENLDLEFIPVSDFKIKSIHTKTKEEAEIDISSIITDETLTNILNQIKAGSGTFEINDFEIIQTALGFSIVKGGNSSQKADIVLDIEHNTFVKENEGFGIKSYLGSKPTLLNASGNTNFMFEIDGLDNSKISEINQISTATKLRDRIVAINKNGGTFRYLKAEKDTMNYNLKMVDNVLPEIIGYLLMAFYGNRISNLSDIVNYLCDYTDILTHLDIDDKAMLINKLKKFLVDILLGFFAGEKWNGSYASNGTIVVKENGDLITFHIINMENLKNYLFENIKLDTPSTSRHKFGTIIQDKTKNYFKLNLQLRF